MRHECVVLVGGPDSLGEVCGISMLERLLRTLQRLGLTKAIVLSATPKLFLPKLTGSSSHRSMVALEIRSCASGPVTVEEIFRVWPNDEESILVIPGDSVFDPRLLQLLDRQNATAALVDSVPPANLQPLVDSAARTSRGLLCGAALLSNDWRSTLCGRHARHDKSAPLEKALREDLEAHRIAALDIASCPLYLASLRRDVRPYWFPTPRRDQQKIAERVLLDAAQKGALDLPAKLHAPIENFLISHLCKTTITPNQLTVFTNLVAWGATFLFATGNLAAGTIIALLVGILDGLDGKLARLKIETSKMGNLEHWFDALFELSWWIALACYFQTSGRLPTAFAYLALLLCAEGAAGLAKWSVIRRCDRLIDEIGDFDRIVRLFGGRRNVYIWLFALGILFHSPVRAFQIMAWWAAVTAALQVPRAIFIVRIMGRKGPV